MTLYSIIFYVIAGIVVASTLLAIIQRLLINAVVYLILSFFATGLLFYWLGAPFLAALEVIIYAGAIMVLFLFVVMTLAIQSPERKAMKTIGHWGPVVVLGVISFFIAGILIFEFPGSRGNLESAMATPLSFGRFVFQNYWFPVEIASFLLLIGLVGALYLGRRESSQASEGQK